MEIINGNMKEILDNLYDGVYIVDKDRRIHYWNKAAEELTGYSASGLLGSCCNDNILNHVDEAGNKLCSDDCPAKPLKIRPIYEIRFLVRRQIRSCGRAGMSPVLRNRQA